MTVSGAGCHVFSAISPGGRIESAHPGWRLAHSSSSQPAPPLRGEAQRVKLATEAVKQAPPARRSTDRRATTGLSFYDVHKLDDVMQRWWTGLIRSWYRAQPRCIRAL